MKRLQMLQQLHEFKGKIIYKQKETKITVTSYLILKELW